MAKSKGDEPGGSWNRFWALVDRRGDDECWPWLGTKTTGGYGLIRRHCKSTTVHRYSYEVNVGPIPEGLHIDHLCRNRGCVNPRHLEAVTPGENLLRRDRVHGIRTAATHCPQGHPYDEANTVINRFGHRTCRECNRQKCSARYYRSKSKLQQEE